MATINPDDFAAYDLRWSNINKFKILAGGNGKSSLAEGDVIKHGMSKVFSAQFTYNDAPGVDSRLFCNLSTEGQVTITDAGANTDGTIIIMGQT